MVDKGHRSVQHPAVRCDTGNQTVLPEAPGIFPVVGIGASAGGLEALKEFFGRLSSPVNMTFAVIMHLDPRRSSGLASLLQKYTTLPVRTIEDGMMIECDRVYVAPPNRDVGTINNTFQLLEPVRTGGLHLPVDFFLQGLAEEKGSLAARVILSGTGSDGTVGLRAIKAEGGLVVVQDRDPARYSGMPASALKTGLADFVLPPGLMVATLTRFFRDGTPIGQAVVSDSTGRGDDDVLGKICVLLRSRTGNDFTAYKKNTPLRRIERRMALHQLSDVSHYIRYLRENPFGEEVYSIAIVVKECLAGLNRELSVISTRGPANIWSRPRASRR